MPPSSPQRQSLLAVVLLAILLGSILIAWSLVGLRRAPIIHSENILRNIRAKTLTAYWPAEPTTHWYLIQDANGRSVGYVVHRREPSREGFTGLVVRRIGNTQHIESWTLDPSARRGSYAATSDTRGRPDTQIVLSEGKVTVVKPWAGQGGRASATAPDNYIPKGLMYLLVAEVAKTDVAARFSMILNSEAIVEGEVYFNTVTLTPRGDGTVHLEATYLQGKSDELLHVDAQGTVFRIDDNLSGATTRRVDVGTLSRRFPEVTNIQAELEAGGEDPSDTKEMEELEELMSSEI